MRADDVDGARVVVEAQRQRLARPRDLDAVRRPVARALHVVAAREVEAVNAVAEVDDQVRQSVEQLDGEEVALAEPTAAVHLHQQTRRNDFSIAAPANIL